MSQPATRAFHTIDEYIAQFPDAVRPTLELVRSTIREAAPEAVEVISYNMPAFKMRGILVYFAMWKKHIGLYPPVVGNKALERAVSRNAGEKGNLKFPLDEPMPVDLIRRIVELRLKLDQAKAPKTSKKSQPKLRSHS